MGKNKATGIALGKEYWGCSTERGWPVELWSTAVTKTGLREEADAVTKPLQGLSHQERETYLLRRKSRVFPLG